MDRFIPSRSAIDLDAASYALLKEGGKDGTDAENTPPNKADYKRMLAEGLGTEKAARILAFKNKAPAPPEGSQNNLLALYSQNQGQRVAKKVFRPLPQHPDKILDAPELLDDYYLNLLDWGPNNVLAVALGTAVYMWNADSGDIQQLMECQDGNDYVTSVSWAGDGKHISVGTAGCQVQIWDVSRSKQVRALNGHAARVNALSWNNNLLSSGGKDSIIVNHDVRQREHIVGVLRGHEQEICGLKWSPNGQQLASGANDNLLLIWDRGGSMLHRVTAHQAAVKGLAWCPFQSNLLASGGGTADRCIRFTNTHTGCVLNSIDTGSQVCQLQWSRHEREILSAHGFSQNQLCLWKYPSMVKMGELSGHTSRVLHLTQSPDGTTVVSGAADETLRFWRIFGDSQDKSSKGKPVSAGGASMLRSVNIR
eukprot:jgi/Astpho2/21/fgenesh1_pm.00001_%23_3_t